MWRYVKITIKWYNIEVIKHNIYYNGKFQNIEFTDNQSDKSIGVLEAGTYTFTTEKEENVKCISGKITINDIILEPGEEITIKAEQEFTISSEKTSAYLCIYK